MKIILNLKIKSKLNFYYKVLTIFLTGLERVGKFECRSIIFILAEEKRMI